MRMNRPLSGSLLATFILCCTSCAGNGAATPSVSANTEAGVGHAKQIARAVSSSRGLYVFGSTAVNVYPANDPTNIGPTCYVPLVQGQPFGQDLSIDQRGHLWVPYGGVITEYGRRCGPSGDVTVIKTLTDRYAGSGGPTTVAFAPDGTVYVDNETGFGGDGNVAVYHSGATSPYDLLYPPHPISQVANIAVDANGNLYMMWSLYPGGISVTAAGKRKAAMLNLTGVSSPVGMAFDNAQNMLVLDIGGPDIAIYAPPYSGSPTATIPLKANHFEYFALDRANKNLYVAAWDTAAVQVYGYPSGTYEYSVSAGLSPNSQWLGVAVDPAAGN